MKIKSGKNIGLIVLQKSIMLLYATYGEAH